MGWCNTGLVKILFLRNEKSFLPEIDAYIQYFNKVDRFQAYDSSKLLGEYNINDFDVIWEFKGFGGIKVNNQLLIHEYASLSTGKFPLIKNKLKVLLNHKPNLRIFLNENVKSGFPFHDNVDFCYRDMGINESFLIVDKAKKEYEFVYVGLISKSRNIDQLLKSFTEKNNGKLCLIGNIDDDIYNEYKDNKNLIFTGKVDYLEVPKIASKAIYGINFIPDKYPYNIQTSTKLLEYLALDLKVITTDYHWIRQFEKKHNCSFYKLNTANLEFDITKISQHEFKSNFNAKDFLWDNVIEQSQILNKINTLLSNRK